jgi:hypothetical protein
MADESKPDNDQPSAAGASAAGSGASASDMLAREDDENDRARSASNSLSDAIANKYDPSRLSKLIVGEAGRGERLDLGTQSEMERTVGGAFNDVRVFRGPLAESITRQHRADAVTIANTGMILMREGPRSNPNSAAGKALLAHELTHVRQAQSGMHFALEGGQGQDAPHEKEAEAIESKVHAQATGKGGGGASADGEGGGGIDRDAVIARVMELVEEHERIYRDRLGGSLI